MQNVKTKGRKEGKEGGREKRGEKRKKNLAILWNRINRQNVSSKAQIGFQAKINF